MRKMEIECFQIYDETMKPYQELAPQARKQVNDTIFYNHGLSLLGKTSKNCCTREWIMNYLLELNKYAGFNCVFAYKGGSIEKELCNELNIAAINLEHFGAVKYEVMCQDYKLSVKFCKAHYIPRRSILPHCSKFEVYVFTAFVYKTLGQQESLNKTLEQYGENV